MYQILLLILKCNIINHNFKTIHREAVQRRFTYGHSSRNSKNQFSKHCVAAEIIGSTRLTSVPFHGSSSTSNIFYNM